MTSDPGLTRRSLIASLAAAAVAPALPPCGWTRGWDLAGPSARRGWQVYDCTFLGHRYHLVHGPTA